MNCCSGCCRYVYAGLLGGKNKLFYSLVALSQDISGISACDQINKQPTNKLPLTLSLFKILNTDTHLFLSPSCLLSDPPYHGSHSNESFLTPPNVCTQSHKPLFFLSVFLPIFCCSWFISQMYRWSSSIHTSPCFYFYFFIVFLCFVSLLSVFLL